MSYATEKEAAADLRAMFNGYGLSFEEQVTTKNGKKIDFVVELPHKAGYKIGVECKKDLHFATNATVLAGYLEQAIGYARDLEMPVFLGPVVSDASPSTHYQGGHSLSSIAALNIFGGRVNVGTLVKQHRYGGVFWFAIYRGGILWDSRRMWEPTQGVNESKTFLVTSTGSKAERTSMKAGHGTA